MNCFGYSSKPCPARNRRTGPASPQRAASKTTPTPPGRSKCLKFVSPKLDTVCQEIPKDEPDQVAVGPGRHEPEARKIDLYQRVYPRDAIRRKVRHAVGVLGIGAGYLA